jgi:hypothetical protein
MSILPRQLSFHRRFTVILSGVWLSVVLLKSHFYRKIVHQNEKLFHSATNIAGSEVPVTYAMYNEYQ